jgi:hypothetical protein
MQWPGPLLHPAQGVRQALPAARILPGENTRGWGAYAFRSLECHLTLCYRYRPFNGTVVLIPLTAPAAVLTVALFLMWFLQVDFGAGYLDAVNINRSEHVPDTALPVTSRH